MLDQLPLSARVWVFQSDRKISSEEQGLILHELNEFIASWASHGNQLFGQCELVENHFVVVGIDEEKAPPSGCSIDKLMRKIQDLGQQYRMDFLNRLNLAIVNKKGEVEIISMSEFKKRAQSDTIGLGTNVFNNLIETKEELETKWKTNVKNSWHKNLLQIQ